MYKPLLLISIFFSFEIGVSLSISLDNEHPKTFIIPFAENQNITPKKNFCYLEDLSVTDLSSLFHYTRI